MFGENAIRILGLDHARLAAIANGSDPTLPTSSVVPPSSIPDSWRTGTPEVAT